MKRVPFLSKMVYKRIRGQTSGRSLPVKLCSVPPGFQTVPYSTFPSRFLVKQSPHVINCLITVQICPLYYHWSRVHLWVQRK